MYFFKEMKRSPHLDFIRLLIWLSAAVYGVAVSGGIVSVSGVSRTCIGWPLCAPGDPIGWISLLHRLLVGAAVILTLFVLRKAWSEYRGHLVVLPLTTVLAVLCGGQIFIGALQATRPAPHLAILHSLTTISVWISLAALFFASISWNDQHTHDHELPSARKLKDFIALTKPWIVALLLVTTVTGLIVGYQGLPPFSLTFWTLLGGFLAAGGSSALNQFIDRDVDKRMQRTAHRPLAEGRLTKAEGLAFGLALCISSYFLLVGFVNLLAAVLALIGIFYYVLIYSIWLKKMTVQNIVIGGGAGAIPPMVGWAAATGHLPIAAWILFAIIFIWTPPHFWALAIVRKKDYERAGIPMLPVIRGEEETRRQILLYTLVLVGASMLLPALQLTGSIYLVSALALGLGLIYAAWKVWRTPGNKVAFLMYRWSSYYLLFLFVSLIADALYRHG